MGMSSPLVVEKPRGHEDHEGSMCTRHGSLLQLLLNYGVRLFFHHLF